MMKLPALSSPLVLLLLFYGDLSASTLRVPADSPTVAGAAQRAAPGDTILVAAGLYRENLRLDKPVVLLGGWDRTFRFRDPRREETILDGEGVNRQVILIRMAGEKSDGGVVVAVDGFTIRNGWVDGNGGGLCAEGKVRVVLRNNVFRNNYARYHGGAVCYFKGASGLVEGNLFDGNAVVFHGGGLCLLDNARVDVSANHFVRNRVVADSGGGVAALKGCRITVRGNRFEENFAIKRGGAISFLQGVEAEVEENLIVRNECGLMGGAIYSWKSFPRIRNNTLVRNYSPETGGIRIDQVGTALVESNLVLTCNGSWLFHEGMSEIESTGNIVYRSLPAAGPEGTEPTGGVRTVDPLVCDETSDYRLRPGSPCLEEGVKTGCYSVRCDETPPPGEPPLGWAGE